MSKHRILKTFAHQEPDQVPIWELGFHNEVARRIMGREIFFAVGGGRTSRAILEANQKGRTARQKIIARIVDDSLLLYQHLGYDMIRIRPTDFLSPFAFGSGNWSPNALLDVKITKTAPNRWRVEQGEFWSDHVYSDQSETLADVDDAIKQGGFPAFERYVSTLEQQPIDLSRPDLTDALDGIHQAIQHPSAKDIFILGWADICYPGSTAHLPIFLEAMALKPELIQRFMEVTTRGIIELIRAQVKLGVDGFTGGNDWAFKTGPMFSTRFLKKFIAPYLKQIVDEIHSHGLLYIKHCDGDLRKHLPTLIDNVGIDGYHSIEPDANMDILDLKNRYGNRLTLLGNLDCDLLHQRTPRQIEEKVAWLMENIAPGGGYVFSTSNTILSGVPLQNLEAMLSAAKKYGKYQ